MYAPCRNFKKYVLHNFSGAISVQLKFEILSNISDIFCSHISHGNLFNFTFSDDTCVAFSLFLDFSLKRLWISFDSTEFFVISRSPILVSILDSFWIFHVKLNFAEENEIELSRIQLRSRLRLAKSFFSAANLIWFYVPNLVKFQVFETFRCVHEDDFATLILLLRRALLPEKYCTSFPKRIYCCRRCCRLRFELLLRFFPRKATSDFRKWDFSEIH